MTCKNHRHSNRHSNPSDRRAHRHDGPIRRVTRALANKIGVPRKVVLVAFIIGLIVSLPLTVLTFFIALYWVNHPGVLERKIDEGANKLRNSFRRNRDQFYHNRYAYAEARASADTDGEANFDFEFEDLRREFDDLERRAADMEEHVASDEYSLNKELKDITKKSE